MRFPRLARLGSSAGPAIIPWVLRLLFRSIRWTWIGRDELMQRRERDGNVIFAFFHGRMLMLPFAYTRRPVRVMVSPSRDGEVAVQSMARLGITAARGSSSRQGAEALQALRDELESGADVGITPDGPKGPRATVKPGAIELARSSGRPLIGLTFSARRAIELGSWDRFLIPLPFTRGVISFGEPFYVPADAEGERFEQCRARFEMQMRQLQQRADEQAGFIPRDPL